MEKITLETLYTPWTLDCYQTFTFDNTIDQIIKYKNSQYDISVGEPQKDTQHDYDDFEWDFDCEGYLKALADNLIEILNEYIIDDVILSVSYDGKVHSPNEYNFVTDKAWLDFEVNEVKLREYVDQHRDEYEKEKLQDRDGFMWFGDEYQTMLSWYLYEVSNKILDWESYYYAQIEDVCADEYVECKLINK